ncbi:putative glutathione transferase [Rosa chinensis]|uniref:Glutathione S-transferase n=1 Tax=Rosa chinensis TaxID=74649 RepID=A0A2P6R2W5_ROSCH|nr:glutathione S-transferase U10 [Rosa chinensis]PRQ40792.1 putative glutathione transferase [Rosa chinensis]
MAHERNDHQVVIYGSWISSFTARVKIALKLKGIDYEYVEEDITNKSQMMLNYNPIHKKVPILVHQGRPIVESQVILEYIDENWSHAPKLLPEDPYEKAKIRFWAKFFDEKIIPVIQAILRSKSGEERENLIQELSEVIQVFEEGMKRDYGEKPPLFNGDSLGFLGIVVSAYVCSYKPIHEAFATILLAEKNPAFFSWVNELLEHPLIKETQPPHDRLVARFKSLQT